MSRTLRHTWWLSKMRWSHSSSSRGRVSECKHLLTSTSNSNNKEPWSECRVVIKSKCPINYNNHSRILPRLLRTRAPSTSCKMPLRRKSRNSRHRMLIVRKGLIQVQNLEIIILFWAQLIKTIKLALAGLQALVARKPLEGRPTKKRTSSW